MEILTLHSSLLQRLYRQDYHKQKDKIHTTYDTPDIKQVKMNQKHLSDVRGHHTIDVIYIPCLYWCSLLMPPFCPLLILVVLQREILQQQRPADLYAHYPWADALPPRQWNHQRGMVKTVSCRLSWKWTDFCWKCLLRAFCVFSSNTKRIWFGWEASAASCTTPQRWSPSATSPNKGYVFTLNHCHSFLVCNQPPAVASLGIVFVTCFSLSQVTYPREAKKNLANFSVVLDTPEYKRVTELKTHMSNVSRTLCHITQKKRNIVTDLMKFLTSSSSSSSAHLLSAHLQSPEQAGDV